MVIDRAVVLQALKAMEANRYAVANQAPHGDVMAYNAAAEALRAAVLAQERAEPKSLPCPTPGACQWHCCGDWCGPRAETKA